MMNKILLCTCWMVLCSSIVLAQNCDVFIDFENSKKGNKPSINQQNLKLNNISFVGDSQYFIGKSVRSIVNYRPENGRYLLYFNPIHSMDGLQNASISYAVVDLKDGLQPNNEYLLSFDIGTQKSYLHKPEKFGYFLSDSLITDLNRQKLLKNPREFIPIMDTFDMVHYSSLIHVSEKKRYLYFGIFGESLSDEHYSDKKYLINTLNEKSYPTNIIWTRILLDNICIQKASKLRRETLYFEVNQHVLSKNSRDILQEIVDELDLVESVELIIKGYADYKGNTQNNIVLSQKRAQFVANFLLKSGFSMQNIRIVGLGEQPIQNDKKLKYDRKVDIFIRTF